MSDLILASGSAIRHTMLEGVGLTVRALAPAVDERALEADLGTITPDALAEALAQAKAKAVSLANPSSLILGADQVLSFEGTLLHKAANQEDAHKKLTLLQGATHQLISAAALVRDGEVLWSGFQEARLTMRSLTAKQISAYLATVGDAATSSVGAYRLEEQGAALFEAIEGDTFTILGLPLLPLLGALRTHGVDPIAQETRP